VVKPTAHIAVTPTIVVAIPNALSAYRWALKGRATGRNCSLTTRSAFSTSIRPDEDLLSLILRFWRDAMNRPTPNVPSESPRRGSPLGLLSTSEGDDIKDHRNSRVREGAELGLIFDASFLLLIIHGR
jgi:hypothetical protein